MFTKDAQVHVHVHAYMYYGDDKSTCNYNNKHSSFSENL